MMIKIAILCFISIILDNIINIYLSYLFSPLFTLITLIFIYNFTKEKEKYFLISIIIGFIYDLFFSNFYILNTFIFFIISFVIYILKSIKNSFLIDIVICIIIILLYNLLLYFIFNFFSYKNIYILDVLYLLPSYLINIIYFILLKIILKTKHKYFN